MRCPSCGYEPRDRLLHKPCPNKDCGFVWVDSESYVTLLCDPIPEIESVLDIGCGLKGMIGQHYWENVRRVPRGYACDRHVLKELPGPSCPTQWAGLLCDAEELVDRLGPRSIDVVTHCGMLEHVEYTKAFRVLHVIERLARKLVFFTCSAVLREVDYKVRRDGNPYHYYRSFWDGDIFEALGYTVDRKRMISGETFLEEVTCWYDPTKLDAWTPRVRTAARLLSARRCCVGNCICEPAWWDPRVPGCFCFAHAEARFASASHKGKPLTQWWEDPRKLEMFPYPPGREKRPLLPGGL